MNFSSIVSRCQARFRDTGGLVVTTDEWKNYINDIYAEVLASRPDWPFMEATSTPLAFAAGAESVDLPADVWRITAAYNQTDGYPLVQIDGRDEAYWLYPRPDEQRGTPQVYRIYSGALYLYPRPAAATNVIVEHFAPPAPLAADADEPVFPEHYHRLLVSGALQLAYEDNGNLQQARAHQVAKEQMISAMAIDLFGPRASAYEQPLHSFFS